MSEQRIGGPCARCGLPQVDRAENCAARSDECAYGKLAPLPKTMRLASMLRLYLAAERMEQKAVCAAIGVNTATLSRFLNGHAAPEAAAFVKILGWCLADE